MVKLLHPENAYEGIDDFHPNSILQPLPIGPAVLKLLHPENTADPILVTLSGIVIFVRLLISSNALVGIKLSHPNSTLQPLPIGPAVLKLLHPENASTPILVTLLGIVIFVRLLHLLN